MKLQTHTIEPLKLRRLEEASDWLLRLQEPTRTEADINEWLRWCDIDPENLVAFETVQRKWQDLDALKTVLEPETQYAAAHSRLARLRIGSLRTVFAMAAGLAAVALTAWVLRKEPSSPTGPLRQISTEVTNRSTTLPDGSKMILGAKSLVNMDFSGAKRQLDLSSGEAYFKVEHDAARPFVVRAGEVSVTAIGTAFDVRRDRDKVTVMVEEGIVEVRGAVEGDAPAIWRAQAGYQVIYSTHHRSASIASIDPSAALSWRSGELAYLYEPLGSVVEDLNRYSARKIVIADPEVAQILFTGTAWANSLDGWLAGIQQAYPVEARESTEGEIVLSSPR